eukprot:SAG22_NODE_152_length_17377_cov_191.856928_25_plen_64_part_00
MLVGLAVPELRAQNIGARPAGGGSAWLLLFLLFVAGGAVVVRAFGSRGWPAFFNGLAAIRRRC